MELCGIFFDYQPTGIIWLGLAMIMADSLYLLLQENRKVQIETQAA